MRLKNGSFQSQQAVQKDQAHAVLKKKMYICNEKTSLMSIILITIITIYGQSVTRRLLRLVQLNTAWPADHFEYKNMSVV